MASELQKPDGLTILAAAISSARIWPLDVRRVPGIGPKTEARLAEIGVHTIGELAAVPIETLVEPVRPLVRRVSVRGGARHRRLSRRHALGAQAAQPRDDLPGGHRRLADDRAHASPASRGKSPRSCATRATAAARSASSCASPTSRRTRARRRFAQPTDSETAIRKAAFECLGRLKLDRRVRLARGAGRRPEPHRARLSRERQIDYPARFAPIIKQSTMYRHARLSPAGKEPVDRQARPSPRGPAPHDRPRQVHRRRQPSGRDDGAPSRARRTRTPAS